MSDRFAVVLADPPWQYRNFADKAHGAAIAHYETSTLEQIQAVPVATFADEDAILALWATWPKLPDAMATMSAWGFDYVTGLPWVKTTPSSGNIRRGIGFWFQGASEMLLIGRRGKLATRRTPLVALLQGEGRQFYAPIGKHSEKPLGIHEWLEAKADGPYLELYATKPREGWTCWGRSLGYELGPLGVSRAAA